jgi:hypothetical protein
MPHAHCMFGAEARIQTHTNITFNILIAFPRQQFLLKTPQCLRSTYGVCCYRLCVYYVYDLFKILGLLDFTCSVYNRKSPVGEAGLF